MRLPGTQAHQSLATLRAGMENVKMEEERRHWGEVPGFPPAPGTSKSKGAVLLDLGLDPKITVRRVGKVIPWHHVQLA